GNAMRQPKLRKKKVGKAPQEEGRQARMARPASTEVPVFKTGGGFEQSSLWVRFPYTPASPAPRHGAQPDVLALLRRTMPARGQGRPQTRADRPPARGQRFSRPAMLDDHDAILREWRENSARDEDANFRFLRSLKLVSDPERIDSLARELHQE